MIAAGAWADLVALDGDPLEDIGVIGDPERMPLIVKDGAVVKNALGEVRP